MLSMRSMKRKCSEQRGFTLIEIIAVLVILAVLAVVAVPKYMDLITESKNKAAMGAVAEGMGRVSMAVGSYLLANPTTTAITAANILSVLTSPANSGDFTLTFAASGTSGINVTASATAGNALGGSASGVAPLPQ
jgi:prepilin-type N-terminal cleavage/methylation domain-containing protein